MRHLQIVPEPDPPPPHEIAATPDWPSIAIPGSPGWWRHCINGRQVDLPSQTPPA